MLVSSVMLLGVIWYAVSRSWSGTTTYTVSECIEAGGKIVDTFNKEIVFAPGELIGNMEGLKCPCVCLRRAEVGGE